MDTMIIEFVRAVHQRNIRETVAGLAVLPLFAAWLYWQPGSAVAVLGKVLVILGVVVALAVTWGRLHIPGSELAAYPPSRHPQRWRHRMTAQAWFLRRAWLWYILPLLGGGGLVALAPTGVSSVVGLAVAGILGAFAVYLTRLNAEAARCIEQDRDAWLGGPSPA
ncbi:hypothetical protein [Tautonia plasticadhaerens]|uniref:Uncharacterized protein n=1 Tax=Tautonia plasticadhaerens TaxID=2527974 RepID=A0A518HAE7_9BACT|nr:hypothetical protein [Tautonia plasticadhaerens]QDV37726.1 hypothetical protein ElP_56710 [Tautonia plasticadhaerens]